ncbi:hypothetical protein SERLA73DRAFT_138762 [Serpula lacrymans var. lacrymans S7.3]|uniref:Uncharacterized protein n=2 Tax=Serpula lacrymans var. lacrymans TaxID=341189 RepID=F8PZP7_SERL3|nr:uncharacterized protein SERLADRAFT_392558 [Serpula lacrymans var. lacrymans S7.9]EGN98369.1 hypothetical protein SERLA73DRAFT_138762 [Serpula lacrymans var. lacrymans S7.3]EGO23924.1 hypothetical protein SERLADRAFT_392558 [Serpula lacrymans var. lacrymans S7.9]
MAPPTTFNNCRVYLYRSKKVSKTLLTQLSGRYRFYILHTPQRNSEEYCRLMRGRIPWQIS